LDDQNKIVISSSTKYLAQVRDFIAERAKKTGADTNTVNQIVMSVDEACTNVIKYTHKYNDSKKIKIEVLHSEKQFKVRITYKGFEFDPNDVDKPNMEEYFAKCKVGGLGIPMMKKFMNKIEYKCSNPDINFLTLTKTLD
jgi:anti-sigma regulatory factor (Ser/Thr protein kinase)